MIILFMKSLTTRRSTRHPARLQTPDSRLQTPETPDTFILRGKLIRYLLGHRFEAF
jgi:hypothetical protein